jgi:hypothetical protein
LASKKAILADLKGCIGLIINNARDHLARQKIRTGCNPVLAAGAPNAREVAKARRSVKRPLMFVESTVEIVAMCRSDRAPAIGGVY